MSEQLPLVVGLKAMQAKGAVVVVVSYSGSSDSGGIDEVVAYDAAERRIEWLPGLKSVVEAWADDHAVPKHGWENNDGGYGDVRLDLATLQAVVTHHDRYTEEDPYDAHERGSEFVVEPPQPGSGAAAALERVRQLGVRTFDINAYSDFDDSPLRLERWSVFLYDEKTPDAKFTEAEALELCAWLNPQLEPLPLASGGGRCQVALDLSGDTPKLTGRHWTTHMGETTDVTEVEL